MVVLELRPPDDLARLLIEGNEAPIQQAGEDFALADGDTTIIPTTADQIHVLWDIAIPLPQFATSFGVEREDVVVASRNVHHAVDDQRIGFKTIFAPQTRPEAGHPGALEL